MRENFDFVLMYFLSKAVGYNDLFCLDYAPPTARKIIEMITKRPELFVKFYNKMKNKKSSL